MIPAPSSALVAARFVVAAVSLFAASAATAQQPYDINGYAKTPGGQAIPDAHVYIDPAIYGSTYETNSLGGYTVIYMPGYVTKYLRITKPGWEFNPSYYTISIGTSGNLTRNFTGAQVKGLTSGQSTTGTTELSQWSYLALQVPAGAASMTLHYEGNADIGIVAQAGTFPTTPPGRGSASRDITSRDVTINAASTPPLSTGRWYFGLYGLAAEPTSWTATIALEGSTGPVTITGKAFDRSGSAYPGARVDANNGALGTWSEGDGTFVVHVPFDWTGTILMHQPHEIFTPGTRTYSGVQASLTGEDFQVAMGLDDVLDAILANYEPSPDELTIADRTGDGILDAADAHLFTLID